MNQQKNKIKSFLETTQTVKILAQTQGFSHMPKMDLNNHIWQQDVSINNDNARFIKITEISKEEETVLRQDLENVISSLKDTNYSWVYYISGTLSGIEIYLGVISKDNSHPVHDYSDLLISQLEGNLAGIQLERIKAEQLENKIKHPLQQSKHFGLLQGIPSRSIDQQVQGKAITQGIDRLARGLSGEVWQLLLVAEPAKEIDIYEQIDGLLQLSSDINPYIKQSQQIGINHSESASKTQGSSVSYGLTESTGTNESETHGTGKSDTETRQKGKNTGGSHSKGKDSGSSNSSESSSWGDNSSESKASGTSSNDSTTKGTNKNKSESKNKTENTSSTSGTNTGSSDGHTLEYVNKKIEHVQKYIHDELLEKLQLGRSKGMYCTAIYLAAKNKVVYDRLSSAMTSIFQGNQSHFSPLVVTPFNFDKNNKVDQLFCIQKIRKQTQDETLGLIHRIPQNKEVHCVATWLNANDISLIAGLPSTEVAGIRLRKNVDFAVNPLQPKDGFDLGVIVQNGRKLQHNPLKLDKKLLNQHIFISGVTGAGKTTTCQQILLNSALPFLVIEPAKTEYRSLSKLDKNIEYYTLGNEKVSPFRFNPFELLHNEFLPSHIDMLKATFAAVFPMEASMPYLIEEAIVRSYEKKGWDIHNSENYLYADPWHCKGQCWPIFSEVLDILKEVIASKNFGMDLQQKYEGSLISRLDNLTLGAKGRMLNTRNSIDIDQLLDKKVVIELEDLKDEQDKCLMMGLLVGRVAEAVKQRHKKDMNFQHLTLLEEAHRLLSKTEPGQDGSKKLGVELFANLLAEVRKYGEGLIIADQIPNKLSPEVLKNTNTKIIHRLFAADDRHAIGDTIGLDDEQKDYLSSLNTGEAIVYSAGWHGAVKVQVHCINDTNAAQINEEVIQKLGQDRVFQQRDVLYPHFSKLCTTTFDAVRMHDYIHAAIRLFNLSIKWANKPSEQLAQIFTKLFLEIKSQTPDSLNTVNLLFALFKDIAPLDLSEIYTKPFTVADLYHIFLQVVDNNKLHFDKGDCEVFADYAMSTKDMSESEKLKHGRAIVQDIETLLKKLKSI